MIKKYLSLLLFIFLSNTLLAVSLNVNISEYPHSSVLIIGDELRSNQPMLKIRLSMSGGSDSFRSITITNNNEVPFVTSGGQLNGITRIALHRDDSDGVFSSDNDDLLESITLDGTTNNADIVQFSGFSPLELDDGDEVLLYVVLDFGNATSVLGNTAKIKASTLNLTVDSSTSIIYTQNNSSQVLLSGAQLTAVEDLSDQYLFRGETAEAVLKVSVLLAGEPMDNILISLTNSEGTFQNNIFEKVSLYEDSTIEGTVDNFDLDFDLAKDVKTFFSDPEIDSPTIEFTITSGNRMATGNYTFFIVYDLLESCPEGTIVRAQISGVQVTGIMSGETVTALGTLPNPVEPAEMEVIEGYTILLTQNSTILTDPVVQGSNKLSVLSFKLQKLEDTLGDSLSVQVRNNGSCVFSSVSDGIDRVWLYKDNPGGGSAGRYDGQDLLVTSSTSFLNGGKDVTLAGIKLTRGEPASTYFLLYDVGVTSTGTFNAVIHDLQSAGSLYMEAKVPQSAEASNNITTIPLQINKITSNMIIVGSTTQLPIIVTMNVENTQNSPLQIVSYRPAFYYDNIHGQNLSAEYIVSLNNSLPLTINPGENIDLVSNVLTTNIFTKGTIRLDGSVQLVTSNGVITHNVFITRAKLDNTQYRASTVGSELYWQVDLGKIKRSWHIPVHIITTNTTLLGKVLPFESGQPVRSSSRLQIYLNTSVIDESTIQIVYNDVNSSQVFSNPNSIYDYTYDSTSGLLTTLVPTVSGKFTLSLNDNSGEPLTAFELDFDITAEFQVNDLLLYPNPYQPNGVDPLVIAFNNNQEAWVDFYLVNAMGQVIWESRDNHFSNIGYNEFTNWAGRLDSGKYLSSGIYSIRLIAYNENGDKTKVRAKLAIR